ncbi:MAG: DNA repair protein RadA [Candidatus Peregrinibacteria bacterium]|nr:DNA repair protein RadA [Candidatus Peregrinibacteria bacterium]MDZ4244807.1 DNA repair protein RadA [Candidatus Gracilibacteria bacterium]
MKLKTIYVCESCQHESSKWVGKCPECNGWNTFTEDVINTGKKELTLDSVTRSNVKTVQISSKERLKGRIPTGFSEVDTVLGGGFVVGSIVLLGGEPGIGKSTLTLQIVDNINESVLYVSGEESPHQINARAKRLGLDLNETSFLETSNLEDVIATLNKEKPGFVVIDSIQVISSELSSGYAGSITQVRYCTETLMHFAKANDITILIIGHVNKDGNLAGPKTLEHLVDCVCMIEGDRYKDLRMLRAVKNRFGSTNEVGLFTMEGLGMKQVLNPSEHILQDRQPNSIGSCLSVVVEGSRPMIVEVQALTSITAFGYPKRAVSGYDANRLQMITAVIQKYADINLLNQDIYINVVGGIRINDPAVDLAVAMAIISSFRKKPLQDNAVALGEIGLSSEIRNVTQLDKRESECKKLGLAVIGPYKTLRETLALF